MSTTIRLAPLFRQVIRANRLLPGQLRALGDTYAFEEFTAFLKAARGKKGVTENQQSQFDAVWRSYCITVVEQAQTGEKPGKDLEAADNVLTAEQRVQLDKLRKEAHSQSSELR